MNEIATQDAATIARAVRQGQVKAVDVVRATLARIRVIDVRLKCFTRLLDDEAESDARVVDAMIARGEDPGELAGVPFGVKNLFDVAGVTTLAGSKILRDRKVAQHDATVIQRLRAAGAILVGTLNMDEFAYGFSTENEHYGVTRNPHDPERIAGGSSGGSAAAVAARLLPITLGSDTNGSVRVPAALCGIYGLKPTYDRLSRDGLFPFVNSFDHVGLFASTPQDLACAYEMMRDPDPAAERRADARSGRFATDGLRVGLLGGWFEQHAGEGVLDAVRKVANAFDGAERVELPHADLARSAAFCITAAESGSLHLENLRCRPEDFDHATRARFLAGALLPAEVVIKAQRFRSWFRGQVDAIFDRYDILLAPATLCSAPRIGQQSVYHDGAILPVRANLGLYTQPISFIGLPVVSAPVASDGGMPLGVQIIARQWREDIALGAAAALARKGVVAAKAFDANMISTDKPVFVEGGA